MINLKFFADKYYIIILINNRFNLNLIFLNQIKEYSLNFVKALNHNLITIDSQKLFDYKVHYLKIKTFN